MQLNLILFFFLLIGLSCTRKDVIKCHELSDHEIKFAIDNKYFPVYNYCIDSKSYRVLVNAGDSIIKYEANFDHALLIFEKALQLFPDSQLINYNLGYLHLQFDSDYEKAIRFFESEIMIDKQSAESFLGLAYSYYFKNMLDSSSFYFDKYFSFEYHDESQLDYCVVLLLNAKQNEFALNARKLIDLTYSKDLNDDPYYLCVKMLYYYSIKDRKYCAVYKEFQNIHPLQATLISDSLRAGIKFEMERIKLECQ